MSSKGTDPHMHNARLFFPDVSDNDWKKIVTKPREMKVYRTLAKALLMLLRSGEFDANVDAFVEKFFEVHGQKLGRLGRTDVSRFHGRWLLHRDQFITGLEGEEGATCL